VLHEVTKERRAWPKFQMVDAFGYVRFFVATAAIGIPVVILTLVVWRLAAREKAEQPA